MDTSDNNSQVSKNKDTQENLPPNTSKDFNDISTNELDNLTHGSLSSNKPLFEPSRLDKGKGRATSESCDKDDVHMTDVNTNQEQDKFPHGSSPQPNPI